MLEIQFHYVYELLFVNRKLEVPLLAERVSDNSLMDLNEERNVGEEIQKVHNASLLAVEFAFDLLMKNNNKSIG